MPTLTGTSRDPFHGFFGPDLDLVNTTISIPSHLEVFDDFDFVKSADIVATSVSFQEYLKLRAKLGHSPYTEMKYEVWAGCDWDGQESMLEQLREGVRKMNAPTRYQATHGDVW